MNTTGSVAAASNDSPSGMARTSPARAIDTVASPNTANPNTRSPGTTWVTPLPTASTTPATSSPKMRASAVSAG